MNSSRRKLTDRFVKIVKPRNKRVLYWDEIQLTDAMARRIGRAPFHGLRFDGRRCDCGDKVGFLEANLAYALAREDLADQVREFLGDYV